MSRENSAIMEQRREKDKRFIKGRHAFSFMKTSYKITLGLVVGIIIGVVAGAMLMSVIVGPPPSPKSPQSHQNLINSIIVHEDTSNVDLEGWCVVASENTSAWLYKFPNDPKNESFASAHILEWEGNIICQITKWDMGSITVTVPPYGEAPENVTLPAIFGWWVPLDGQAITYAWPIGTF